MGRVVQAECGWGGVMLQEVCVMLGKALVTSLLGYASAYIARD